MDREPCPSRCWRDVDDGSTTGYISAVRYRKGIMDSSSGTRMVEVTGYDGSYASQDFMGLVRLVVVAVLQVAHTTLHHMTMCDCESDYVIKSSQLNHNSANADGTTPLHHLSTDFPSVDCEKFGKRLVPLAVTLHVNTVNADANGGWIRDLVVEGVEPNPGPELWFIIKTRIKAVMNTQEWQRYEPLFDEFEKFVRANLADDPILLDATHIMPYIGKLPKEVFGDNVNQSNELLLIGLALSRGTEVNVSADQILDILHDQVSCALDKPEQQRVSPELPFFGRLDELDLLYNDAQRNIQHFKKQLPTKQMYNCQLLHGGLGVGKTRLALEYHRGLQHRNPDFRCACIMMDFARGDNHAVSFNDPDNMLGLCLMAHYFFGRSALWLSSELSARQLQTKLTFFGVMQCISSRNHDAKPILLGLHIDEFGLIPAKKLKAIITKFCAHMLEMHERRICLLPSLSGTTTAKGVTAITLSCLALREIMLQPLLPDQGIGLIKKALEVMGRPDLAENRLLTPVAASLGNYPRHIELFLLELGLKMTTDNVMNLFRDALDAVAKNIRDAYATQTWSNLVGGTQEGVTRMCEWVLSGKEVKPSIKLNGVTVEDVRSTGIIQLRQVGSDNTLFTMHLPLVTLAALNLSLQLVPSAYLNPLHYVGYAEFEHVMGVLRVVRNNLLVNLNQTTATYSELYPHAVGNRATLDQKVSIKRLEIFKTFGNSANKESFHDHNLNKIPVGLAAPSGFIDATMGAQYVTNVDKAPSNDAIVIHPSNSMKHIEGIQYKSSAYITLGMSPRGRGVLKIGSKPQGQTVRYEYAKVTNAAHRKFYGSGGAAEYQFTLAVVSNKPLVDWGEIKPTEWPKNVLIICNENFEQYASIFAHSGLYIKYAAGHDEEAEVLGAEGVDDDQEFDDEQLDEDSGADQEKDEAATLASEFQAAHI